METLIEDWRVVKWVTSCNEVFIININIISKTIAIQNTCYILLNRDYLINVYTSGKEGKDSQAGQGFTIFFFKSSFKLQPYLYTLNFSKYRYAMSKLRMSSHRLHIETGR